MLALLSKCEWPLSRVSLHPAFAALLLAALASGATAAADVVHAARSHDSGELDIYRSGSRCVLALDGPLDAAAERALDAALRELQRDGCQRGTMVFNTGGGTPAVAYRLADFLDRHRFDTAVAEGGLCFSACAYAFLGGRTRLVAEGARYGVHQHTQTDGQCALELSGAERERLRGVVQRALPQPAAERLIARVMATDCRRMDVLSREELQALAVNTAAQSPLEAPFREAMARRAAQVLAELRGSAETPWRRLTGDARLTLYTRGTPEPAGEGRLRLRVLLSHAGDDTDGASGLRYRSQLTLNEIDCARRTLLPLRTAYMREAMGEGAVLRQAARGPMQVIGAGTAAAVFYRAACGKPLPA